LNEIGLSFNDAHLLVSEYGNELDWLFETIVRNIEKNKIRNELINVSNIAIANQTGTKKGNTSYTIWRNKKINKLEELNEPIKEKTIFDKIKDFKKESSIFIKLKNLKKRGLI